MHTMNRQQALDSLENNVFDVCIIGAGASGAGCALDAALRGYKVLLIDQKDIASETSSRSTKLIHGGVRYLEQAFKKLDFAQLKQVRHGLHERRIVWQNAPHLARPLALLTPVSSWIEGVYYSIGLTLYDWIAGKNDTMPKSRWLNKKEALTQIPTLDASTLHSAVLYYDGQLDDARYCLAIAQTAQEKGATVLTYTSLVEFSGDENSVKKAVVRDELSGTPYTVQARYFLNCTGPYADAVRLKANPALPKRLRPSKGVHVMLPKELLSSEMAMLIPKTSDGRVVFAIPFADQLMLGTTDDEYNDLDQEPTLRKSEVDFLLETLAQYLSPALDAKQVKAGFGGLRPLLAADPRKNTKRLTRDHEVEVDEVSGLISLLGGKWTTYRLMAQDAIDELEGQLGKKVTDCKTDTQLLVGAEGFTPEGWPQLQAKYGLREPMARTLHAMYGSRAPRLAELLNENPTWAEPLHPDYPYYKVQVIYAVRYELALLPRDVLARRMRLELSDWAVCRSILPEVMRLMALELGWTDSQKERYEAEYNAQLIAFQQDASR